MSDYDGKVVFGLEVDDSGVEDSVKAALSRVEAQISRAGIKVHADEGAKSLETQGTGDDHIQALAQQTSRAVEAAAENAAAAAEQARAADRAAGELMEMWAAASSAVGSVRRLGAALKLACTAAQKLPGTIGTLAGRLLSKGRATVSEYAVGLDSVPYDNYPALLHRGEMVLNVAEAGAYRMNGGMRTAEAGIDYEKLASALRGVAVEMDGRTVGRLVERGVSEAQGARCSRAARRL